MFLHVSARLLCLLLLCQAGLIRSLKIAGIFARPKIYLESVGIL